MDVVHYIYNGGPPELFDDTIMNYTSPVAIDLEDHEMWWNYTVQNYTHPRELAYLNVTFNPNNTFTMNLDPKFVNQTNNGTFNLTVKIRDPHNSSWVDYNVTLDISFKIIRINNIPPKIRHAIVDERADYDKWVHPSYVIRKEEFEVGDIFTKTSSPWKMVIGYGYTNDGKWWLNDQGEFIPPPTPLACWIESFDHLGSMIVKFNASLDASLLSKEIVDAEAEMEIDVFEYEERGLTSREPFKFTWETEEINTEEGTIKFKVLFDDAI